MIVKYAVRFRSLRLPLVAALISLLAVSMLPLPHLGAQEANEGQDAASRADEALSSESAPEEEPAADAAVENEAAGGGKPSIDVLELVLNGGLLMIPIGLMSVLVATMAVERGLALRQSKVMPPELISGLSELAPKQGGFDPRKAYRLCQQYPSAAATVIRSMLLKVGRPHSEVEHAVKETSEREAARLYANVRTLNLAATVTPLIGLLGTVSGMIQAFFATANAVEGVNKAQQLADGIYVALVTTAGGLSVAIPAAVVAHIFEGRIQKMLREIDELLFTLLPQVERFEGKLRVSRQHLGDEADGGQAEAADAEERSPAATAR